MISHSTTNFQPTDPYMQAAQIAALNQKKQLEDTEKSKQSENIFLIFKMFGEMYGLVKEREMEKKLLGSSNEILKIEITQLEIQYAEELDTSKEIKLIAKMVVTAIQSIELNFQACRNEYPLDYHSDRVSEFAILREKVTKLASQEVKDSPKLETIQEDDTVAVLEKAISPISNMLILDNVEPMLKDEIEVLAKKYEVLENDVSPLRLENQALIHQKQRIVEIHKENMKHRNLNSPIKKILEEVQATNSNLVWEQLAKVNLGAFSPNVYSPFSAKYLAGEIQKGLDKYIASGKNQMSSLITSLETFNNINQGSK